MISTSWKASNVSSVMEEQAKQNDSGCLQLRIQREGLQPEITLFIHFGGFNFSA